MMKWLKKVRAPKFYRYFFYRGYVISKSCSDTEPAFSSTVGMSATMAFQFTFSVVVIGEEVLKISALDFFFMDRGPFEIIGYNLLFLILAFFLFYYNGKWQKIVQEFEGENEKQRFLGKYYFFLYLFISLLGLLWGLTWLVTIDNPNYAH